MNRVNFYITVSGRVQGVSFRYFAREQAEKLGLTGWVKDNPNGSVSLEIEGEKKAVENMLAWCHKGPSFSKVSNVDIQPGLIKNHSVFEITS